MWCGNKWRLASYLELQGHKTLTLMKEENHKCLILNLRRNLFSFPAQNQRLTRDPKYKVSSEVICLALVFAVCLR